MTEKQQQDAVPKSAQGKEGGQSKNKGGRPKGGHKYVAQQDIQNVLTMAGSGLMFLDGYDGQRVVEQSEDIAKALYKLQKEQDQVRRALMALVATSTWGALASAVMPVVVPILANHRLIPAETATLVGAPPPPWHSAAPPPPTGGNGDSGGGMNPTDVVRQARRNLPDNSAGAGEDE